MLCIIVKIVQHKNCPENIGCVMNLDPIYILKLQNFKKRSTVFGLVGLNISIFFLCLFFSPKWFNVLVCWKPCICFVSQLLTSHYFHHPLCFFTFILNMSFHLLFNVYFAAHMILSLRKDWPYFLSWKEMV